MPFGRKGVFGSILMKYKINQCPVYFWNMVLNLCGYRAGVTNKKAFPSGVWTEKWKVLRQLDSSSSLAAIVLSRNRDLSNQTQVYHYRHQNCVTATLEATYKNTVQATLEDTTHFHRREFSSSWVMSEPRYRLERDGALGRSIATLQQVITHDCHESSGNSSSHLLCICRTWVISLD